MKEFVKEEAFLALLVSFAPAGRVGHEHHGVAVRRRADADPATVGHDADLDACGSRRRARLDWRLGSGHRRSRRLSATTPCCSASTARYKAGGFNNLGFAFSPYTDASVEFVDLYGEAGWNSPE